MKTTTDFRPSIHGWPFVNSFSKSVVFDEVRFDMGFCGGMCWRALKRYYNGEVMPRNLPQPVEGEAIFEEIWDSQKESLPSSTLWKFYTWQMSPDLGHWNNPMTSQGHRTQGEWPSIRKKIDANKPVTISLVASSNDANVAHLSDSHRVIAYAYDIVDTTNGDGSPEGAKSKVTLWIYDPNYPHSDDAGDPDSDEITLTFFLGADHSKILLRHSEGDEFHGFFKDDKNRSYIFNDPIHVQIDSCVQTGFASSARVNYDLQISWQCRIVPYFNLIIDNQSWRYNSAPNMAKDQFVPVTKDNKQCTGRIGNLVINLQLPRDIVSITVQLLDSDDFTQSIEIDAQPDIKCLPYIHNRAGGEASQVYDSDIKDVDLYIHNADPSQAEVDQLDTSVFRWVMDTTRRYTDNRRAPDDLTTAIVVMLDKTRLGNLVVPVLGDFLINNMADPVTLTGTVRRFRHGALLQETILNPVATQGQLIFDGFQDNPDDYNEDTKIVLDYRARDRFGVSATGQATFYGQSILYTQTAASVTTFDPAKLGKLEAIARELIERGLIDTAIKPPHSWRGPRPRTNDPVKLNKKLRKSRLLQNSIDKVLEATWKNKHTWKQVWKAQSTSLKQTDFSTNVTPRSGLQKGGIVKTTLAHRESMQHEYDMAALQIVSKKAITSFKRDHESMKQLMNL